MKRKLLSFILMTGVWAPFVFAQPHFVAGGLFSMEAPSGWEIMENSRNRTGVVTVLTPARQNGIKIIFQPEPDLLTNEIPHKIQRAMNSMAAALKSRYRNPVLEQEAVIIAGVPSGRIQFEANDSEGKTQGVQLIILHKDYRFSITYLSQDHGEFQQMDQIIQTLSFDEPGSAGLLAKKRINPLELKSYNQGEVEDRIVAEGEIKNTGTSTIERSLVKLLFQKVNGETILVKSMELGQMWAHQYRRFHFELTADEMTLIKEHKGTYKAELGLVPLDYQEDDDSYRWFSVKTPAAGSIVGHASESKLKAEVSSAEIV